MHPAFLRVDHRPWRLPADAWSWRQSWCDLLFAHWPVPAALLRPRIPPRLALQEFEGTAWLGIVPFRMEGVMRRPLPDMPFVSAFPELNVRTYVELDGKPGVWFLSLDATNALAVFGGRRFFDLPYHHAEIAIGTASRGGFDYRLARKDRLAAFDGSYRPTGEVYEARPGTLEHFLTERYCLYAESPSGRISCTEVHHVPWPLQHAELELRENRMTEAFEFALPGAPALLHFARRVDVVVWSPGAPSSQHGQPR